MTAPFNMFRRQALLHWVELGLLIFFVAGSLVLVNHIAKRHSVRFDLTPEKRYTLASQTRQVLDRLESPLKVTVFARQQDMRELQDQLELFSRQTTHFTYELLDLEKNPARAEAMNVRGYGAGVVEYAGRREKIQTVSEDGLLAVILKLVENREKTVRFVKGHGEKDISGLDPKNSYTQLAKALQAENYKVQDILLLQAQAVPADTSVLVIAGPEKDFLPQEIKLLDGYLKSGGKALLLVDPFPIPELQNYLKSVQIDLARDYIVDTQSKLMTFDHLTPIIVPDRQHPIARTMNEAVVFPICRSVVPRQSPDTQVLALSGAESWAETDTQSVRSNTVNYNPNEDRRGPMPVAAIVNITGAAPQGQAAPQGALIVMGCSNFTTNHYINVLGNKDFFINAVNFLAEKTGLFAERSRSGGAPVSMFFLTELQSRLVFWSVVVGQPSLVLLIGILVAAWRRMKR